MLNIPTTLHPPNNPNILSANPHQYLMCILSSTAYECCMITATAFDMYLMIGMMLIMNV